MPPRRVDGEITNFQEFENISTERVLEMTPKQLVDFFCELERNDQLENFLSEAVKNEALIAQLSYWEKWFEKDHQIMIDQIVAKKKEAYDSREDKESLPNNLDKKFTENELGKISKNLGSIQLTFGCSKGCPLCALDAVAGVRESIPYSQLANLFQKYGKQLEKSKPILYWASEPSDYASQEGIEDRTYEDIHELAQEYANYSPHITSRELDNTDWIKFLISKGNSRVSLFGRKLDSINEESLSTLNNPEKNINNVKFTGLDQTHLKGIGKSRMFESSANETSKYGIGCFNGVLLTPRGLYNVVRLPISDRFPQGQAIVPIEKISDSDERPEIKIGDNITSLMSHNIVKLKRTNIFIAGKEYNDNAFSRIIYFENNKWSVFAEIDNEGNIISF